MSTLLCGILELRSLYMVVEVADCCNDDDLVWYLSKKLR